MKSYRKILVAVCAVWTVSINAQISSRLEQFYLDPTAINPASLSMQTQAHASLFYNKAYAGVPGSPQNILANISLPGKDNRTGFGLFYLRENAGFGQLHNAYISYSYSFPVGQNGHLGFGASGGVLSQSFDASKAVYVSNIDPVVNALMYTPASTRADLKASVFYTVSGFSAGITASRLTTPSFSFNYYKYAADYSLQNITNLFLSYNIQTAGKSVIRPSVVLNAYNMNYIRWQANLSWFYDNKFWLGVSAGDASHLGFNLGFAPHDGVKIGYQVSVPVGTNAAVTGLTHELYTGISLGSMKSSSTEKLEPMPQKNEDVTEKSATPDKNARRFVEVKVSKMSDLENQGMDLDTSGIKIQPLDSASTPPGIYLVVGLHSDQNAADVQIKELYMQGFYSWKFYDHTNKSYYVYIRQFSSRSEASRFIMNNDTGLPQAWIREVK